MTESEALREYASFSGTPIEMRAVLLSSASRIEKLEAALSLSKDWIEKQAGHAGDLCTSKQCVCGKALMLFNARKTLEGKDE
jgi:hypothetical protein